MSKAALAAGTLPTVVHIGRPDPGRGSGLLDAADHDPARRGERRANGGTEYFLSALDFDATLDDRITLWALTNTAA